MGVNLKLLDTEEAATRGGRCVLVHPDTRKPLTDEGGQEAVLFLAGKDSEQYQRTMRKQQARRLEAAVRARRLKNVRGEELVEEIEQDTTALLVAVTLGWEGITMGDGEFPYSPENAKRLYDEGPAWVSEQAQEYIDERGNFLPPSKTT